MFVRLGDGIRIQEGRLEMENNIFLENKKMLTLADYMDGSGNGRSNLGNEVPVAVYRLFEYSLKEELAEKYGEEVQVRIFRNAGYRAGVYFAEKYLNLTKPLHEFLSELQKRMEEMRIGILRIESLDEKTGRIVLTVSEDTDCSGLPPLGETVCNYDEGFLAGILSTYTDKNYIAVEVDCWATGARVCRFRAEVQEEGAF